MLIKVGDALVLFRAYLAKAPLKTSPSHLQKTLVLGRRCTSSTNDHSSYQNTASSLSGSALSIPVSGPTYLSAYMYLVAPGIRVRRAVLSPTSRCLVKASLLCRTD
jgi:hypothetical protein